MRYLCYTYCILVSVASLAGQTQGPTSASDHATAVVRPLSLVTSPTPLLQAIADTTLAHIVVGLKAAGVEIVDRSQRPVRASDLTSLVATRFAVLGVVGMVDTQCVMIVRLASMGGDSLSQVRLLGPPTSAAAFGDSLASLFAPTILGRPPVPR